MKLMFISCFFWLTLNGAISAEKPLIAVTILPQKFFAARILGDTADVVALIAPGKSPHDYTLTPLDMANLARARAWFTIGLPLEKTLTEKFTDHEKILPTQRDIVRLPLNAASDNMENNNTASTCANAENHQHANCAADGLDPHIWLDPVRAQKICENLRDGLVTIFPQHRERYQQNAAALIADLQQLDADLKKILAPLDGKEIIVFHPAFGYFCARYGLRQLAIEREGKTPSAAWLGRIVQVAQRKNIRVVFVQPQFNQTAARAAAAAINGVVLPFDALPENYLTYLRAVAQTLAENLSPTEKYNN